MIVLSIHLTYFAQDSVIEGKQGSLLTAKVTSTVHAGQLEAGFRSA